MDRVVVVGGGGGQHSGCNWLPGRLRLPRQGTPGYDDALAFVHATMGQSKIADLLPLPGMGSDGGR
jgi:hypothetical protein